MTPNGPQYTQFEAAKIGLVGNAQASQHRPLVIIKPRRTLPSFMAVLGGVVVLAGAGYAIWGGLPQKPPPPATSAAPRLAPIPPTLSSVSGLSVPDASRADPSILLPRIQRALFSRGEPSALIRIKITGSTRGTVDLSKPGATIEYVYREAGNPREKGAPVTNKSYELRAGGGGATEIAATKNEWEVPEPNCTWTAAWRAAVKSGVPEDAVVDGLYEKLDNEPRWRISVPEKPDLTRDLDGMSCAIKVR